MRVFCVWLAGLIVSGVVAQDTELTSWTGYRGPAGDGRAAGEARGLPLSWAMDKNVAWRTPIHGRGWSSPVVFEGRVWLTTATEDGTALSVMCLDEASGKLLVDRVLFTVKTPEPLGNPVNGYASPSPVIEKGRVYVHFGSYGTACLDSATGKTLWERRDLPCRHFRGPGSSPFLYKDLLILTMDGIDVQYLVALNTATGRDVWKTPRTTDFKDLNSEGRPTRDGDQRKAYTTPLLISTSAGDVIVSGGAKAAFAYDPKTGDELWSVTYAGYSAASGPVAGAGMVVVNSGYGKPVLSAVKLGGKGDVTTTRVVWTYMKGVPKRSSPVIVDGRVYMVNDAGIATCLELKTGKEVWKGRLNGKFSASVLYADGHLFYFDEQGKSTVVKPGPILDIVSVNTLDAGCMASVAVVGRAFIMRTTDAVVRLEVSGN